MHKEIRYISDSWSQFDSFIQQIVISKKVRSVIEIGGGANPALSKEFVLKYGLEYHVQDIDHEELEKASGDYFNKYNSPIANINYKYDLVITKMVLEHIEDPNAFHKDVQKLMKSNSIAIHFFATLYNIASIPNLILPEKIASQLQQKFNPRTLVQHDKFPAYYRKCFGPTIKNIHYFASLGFIIDTYIGFVGHNYFWKYKWLYKLENKFSNFLLKLSNPCFCSNAILVLKVKEIQ
jgi:hypothetical protein